MIDARIYRFLQNQSFKQPRVFARGRAKILKIASTPVTIAARCSCYQIQLRSRVIRMIRMSYDAFCRPGTGRQKGDWRLLICYSWARSANAQHTVFTHLHIYKVHLRHLGWGVHVSTITIVLSLLRRCIALSPHVRVRASEYHLDNTICWLDLLLGNVPRSYLFFN